MLWIWEFIPPAFLLFPWSSSCLHFPLLFTLFIASPIIPKSTENIAYPMNQGWQPCHLPNALTFLWLHSKEPHFVVVVLVAMLCPTLLWRYGTVAQAPLSMEFSRQDYWSGLPFPSPGGVFSTPGSNLCLLHWQEHSLPLSHKGSPKRTYLHCKVKTRNPVHTGILKQRQPTKTYRELCSMVCGSLDGRGVWGRIDTCKCMAESLCYAPETITTLLISYTQIESLKV